MNIYIIPEPLFEKTVLFKDLLDGMKASQLSKKLNLIFGTTDDNFLKKVSCDNHVAIVPATSRLWINTVVRKFVENKIHPIFISPSGIDFSFPFSNITLNYSESTYHICNYFKKIGCESTAFFGFNRDSGADNLKLAGFKYANTEEDFKDKIFVNKGNISGLVNSFLEKSDSFDSIVSTNDYVSIALIKRLFEIHSSKNLPLKIASFGKTLILKELFPDIIRVTINFFEAGKKAAELYHFIAENPSVSLTLTVKNKIIINDEEAEIDDLKSYINISSNREFDFYGDSEVMNINKIELMLQSMTETDKKILKLLTSGNTYEKTAELCHVGITTVKYRLNKLKKLCGISDNREMLEIYKNYT